MEKDKKRTLLEATAVATIAVIALGFYVQSCANVHLCDFLSLPAVALLWLTVMVGRADPNGELGAGGLDFWVRFALITFVWVWPVTYGILQWVRQRRSHT